ncbi:hypothetical protein GCM10028778_00270 [Barrientosiimonas marina]|uniref:Uncharacterized protein n=1 Tax=Lentibacillus kimchii TaxID=1542911 RepID=A0ABW2URQ8_9BACI
MQDNNNPVKKSKTNGESKNGRKSQYKNSSVHGDTRPDEYVSEQDD